MTLGLQLRQRVQVVMRCDCCPGHIEDHEEGCPRKALRVLFEGLHGANCPVCHREYVVHVNMDDYLECSNTQCRAVFTRSEIAAGYDPDKIERMLMLNFSTDEHFSVLRIPKKGRGRFRHKQIERNLRLSIREARARMREARKKGSA